MLNKLNKHSFFYLVMGVSILVNMLLAWVVYSDFEKMHLLISSNESKQIELNSLQERVNAQTQAADEAARKFETDKQELVKISDQRSLSFALQAMKCNAIRDNLKL
jgi:septal ring-binding cell division protein DamX